MYILIKIFLKFVPNGSVSNKLSSVQIIVWHEIGSPQVIIWNNDGLNYRHIQCGAVISRWIFSQIFTKDTLSSTIRVNYRVSFVDPASDWYSATVAVIILVISYNNGPRYNGTRLYMHASLGLDGLTLQELIQSRQCPLSTTGVMIWYWSALWLLMA